MSLFSFLKRSPFGQSGPEDYSLILSIGSGSVSGGIIRFTEKPGEEIVSYAKETIPFQPEISIPKHLELMKTSLGTLIGRIRTDSPKKISNHHLGRVFYIFASPWSISQTKTIRINEPKAFKVTEAYLAKVIDEQEKQFQSDISQSGTIIEKKIIQIKINGYVVNDIYGRTTKNLEVSVILTVVPKEILETVKEAATRTFDIKSAWCHSLSLAIFSTVRNLFPQKEDFIHLDVGEEMTDISVIKDNIIISNASIPFGRNHFIRQLSSILKMSPEVTDSMLRMHLLKNNDELATINFAVAMDSAARGWLTRISGVLNRLKEKLYIPESIFLIANSDLTRFLKEKLEKQDYKVLLIDNSKIKPAVAEDDIMFRLILMFLDNLYKI